MHGHDGLDLLVVGSANADLVIGVDRRPAAGETVLGSDLATRPGGKGANQAAAAARLGARAGLLGRVGDDAHGRLLLDALREAGADTSTVLVGGAPTGVALITVDGEGDNSIVVSPGANSRLTPEDVAGEEAARSLAAAAVVSLQLEIPPETVAATVRAAVRAGTRVVLNPSPPAPLPDEVLAACDPLVVNEHEARALLAGTEGRGVAESGPVEWASALLARGPRAVVITLGSRGALIAEPSGGEAQDAQVYQVAQDPGDTQEGARKAGDGGSGEHDAAVGTSGARTPGVRTSGRVRTVRVPSPAVRAVDTTGAGDAFTGALAWRLARGSGLEEAVRYAARVGAVAVTRPGAQESYPAAAELALLYPEDRLTETAPEPEPGPEPAPAKEAHE